MIGSRVPIVSAIASPNIPIGALPQRHVDCIPRTPLAGVSGDQQESGFPLNSLAQSP